MTRAAATARRQERTGRRLRHKHRDAMAAAARRLRERPLAHGFALLLLAMGLLFLSLLAMAAGPFAQLSSPLAGARTLSLFLDPQIDAARAEALADELRSDARVATVDIASPDEGLRELANLEGSSQALAALPDNPLPWVLAIEPADRTSAQALAAAWRERQEVAYLADEGDWLDRADAALGAVRMLALALAVLVVVALVLLAANAVRTIRFEGASERALQRVFGATEGDLRRPYLYLGLIYGLVASLAALLAAAVIAVLVQPAFAALAALLDQPAARDVASFLLPLLPMVPAAALLGWIGAWLGCLFERDMEASE